MNTQERSQNTSPKPDEPLQNRKRLELLKAAFPDYNGPGPLYLATYKYTDCGPVVGLQLYNRSVHCSSLLSLGTWDQMMVNNDNVVEIMISSIIEGVDECTTMHHIVLQGLTPKELRDKYWEAVGLVNNEVNEIWNRTHGCHKCAERAGYTNGERSCKGEDGITPVDPNCPGCEGHGCVI